MNLKQLLMKLSRIFGQTARKAAAGKSGTSSGAPAAASAGRGKPSPQQRQRDKASREAVKRARQAARITKRMR